MLISCVKHTYDMCNLYSIRTLIVNSNGANATRLDYYFYFLRFWGVRPHDCMRWRMWPICGADNVMRQLIQLLFHNLHTCIHSKFQREGVCYWPKLVGGYLVRSGVNLIADVESEDLFFMLSKIAYIYAFLGEIDDRKRSRFRSRFSTPSVVALGGAIFPDPMC